MMTVGGGGGGGGEGIRAISELVTSFRLGATAVTKLSATAWAGAGTGSLPGDSKESVEHRRILCTMNDRQPLS